jgi:hypothetical protein
VVFTTDAEERGEMLNPWVQWVSVHSGLSAAQHGIHFLSDGHKLREKAIWDVLSEAGKTVWVCGSMNARYDRPLNGYLLPDPWATGLVPYPPEDFQDYYAFVRKAVQEHSRQDALSVGESLRFLRYLANHGLSPSKIMTTLGQLWTERNGKKRWRRAVVLDFFQWDLFAFFFKRLKPDFSSFFLNSTAHLQHCYWRNMEPELFSVKPPPEEQQELGGAVLFGYQKMDQLIGRFLNLADPQTTLIFCTALSQQPFLKFETSGGRHYYRLRRPANLGEMLSIADSFEIHPVMAEQFCLRFSTREAAARANQTLSTYGFEGKPVFHATHTECDLMLQCNLTAEVPADATITSAADNRTIPFFDIFYPLHDLKSGYHHPEGMLWVRRPERDHAVYEKPVSLMSIAPAILEMLEVHVPDIMTHESLTRWLQFPTAHRRAADINTPQPNAITAGAIQQGSLGT